MGPLGALALRYKGSQELGCCCPHCCSKLLIGTFNCAESDQYPYESYLHCSLSAKRSARLRRERNIGIQQAPCKQSTSATNQCPPRVIRCERVLRKRTKSVLSCSTASPTRTTRPRPTAAPKHWACSTSGPSRRLYNPQRSGQSATRKSVAKGADGWLTLQRFDNVASCVSALRVEGWDIWCAADGEGAVELGSERPPDLTPAKVAVVIGADAAS